MLPTLPFLFIDLFVCSCVSKSERERERAGGLARVCVCVRAYEDLRGSFITQAIPQWMLVLCYCVTNMTNR